MKHDVKLLIMGFRTFLHIEGAESQSVLVQKGAKTGRPEYDPRFCVQM